MPIDLENSVRRINEKEFKEVDFEVMRCAFRLHNEMGKLFQENQYQNEMCEFVGRSFPVCRESTIAVKHKSFQRNYRLDFLVANGAIYEFKSTSRIDTAHEGQLLQYMLLSEASRGKVVNFGEGSVKGKLISSSLTHGQRSDLKFNFDYWESPDRSSENFAALIVELLKDIGGFLSIPLYQDAMVELLGGTKRVVRSVGLKSYACNHLEQRAHLLNDHTAFKLTALKAGQGAYRNNLKKFLSKTELQTIQWVNLDNHAIQFESVRNN